MKIMKTIRKYSALAIIIALGACEQYQLPEIAGPAKGTADFTKTVAVGSSLTAGFMNGALYTAGQNASFMSILTKQMKSVGGGEFNQPDINAVNGDYGITQGSPGVAGRLYLKGVSGTGCSTVTPAPAPKLPGNAITAYSGDKTKLNNFSAYRASIQLSLTPALGGPATGNAFYNPWFGRFAASPSVDGTTGSSLIGDAAAALGNNGTFFVFWLGIDDVLGYALNGAVDGDPTAPLTATATFNAAYNQALTAMLNAKTTAYGIVGNIPDLTSLPYFTTVKWNQVVFLSCDPASVTTVAQLNAGYGSFNSALNALVGTGTNQITQAEADKRKVVFKTGANATLGANAVVIVDETLVDLGPQLGALSGGALAGFGRVRQATSSDLIVLPAGAVLPNGVGINPAAGFLTDKYVILPSEAATIQASITAFNATIKTAVDAQPNRLALFDANAVLKQVATGTVAVNGSSLTASVTPPAGAFSLDGVHPNARGQAYIANKFIEVINAKWEASIPLCNPNDYPGNEFPIP